MGLLPLMPSPALESTVDDTYKGKNKVGFNLLLWSAVVSEKMTEIASRLKETGYDGVEVAMAETSTGPYVSFGKYVKQLGLETSVVLAVGERRYFFLDGAIVGIENQVGAELECERAAIFITAGANHAGAAVLSNDDCAKAHGSEAGNENSVRRPDVQCDTSA